MHCICGKEFCWTCLKGWEGNDHGYDICKESKKDTYTFSSLDDEKGVVFVLQYKKAKNYYADYVHVSREVDQLDTQLQRLKNKSDSDETKDRLRLLFAKRALKRVEDTYRLLEMMHVQSCRWQSRHTIYRLTCFAESVEYDLQAIENEKEVPVSKTTFACEKKIAGIIQSLDSKLSDLKKFGL